eukprot:m.22601 g.22601  ORF g.22601 m.22601 type:complete len:2904 (-) comp13869_c0_seq1:198-8909(-)
MEAQGNNGRAQEYIKFGDICTFRCDEGYIGSSLTSAEGNYSGVFARRGTDIDPGQGDFRACQFQLVGQEKYKHAKELAKQVKLVQTTHRKEYLRQKRKSQAAATRNAKSQNRTSATPRAADPSLFDPDAEMSVDDALDKIHDTNLKEQSIHEARDNQLEQNRRHGLPVRYGQVVQMWQPYSRRFLQVSPSMNALSEPSNLKVVLSPLPSRECYFRIMPRFKARALNDLICVDDEIVLESEKSAGQFLYCSPDPLHESKRTEDLHFLSVKDAQIDCSMYEVSLSVAKGKFILSVLNTGLDYAHRRYGGALEQFTNGVEHTDDFDDQAGSISVRTGTAIQLFHKDTDAWLAAEGLFADPHNLDKFQMNNGIHLRQREPDPERPSRLAPPTSALSYFVVEKVDRTNEGVVLWQDAIRLKHLVSQRYLCLTESVAFENGDITTTSDEDKNDTQFELGLTDDVLDDRTHFAFTPLIADTDYVPVDAYAHIQHVKTKRWLHASDHPRIVLREKPVDHTDDSVDVAGFTERMMRAKWDGAALVKIVTVEDQHQTLFDAFSLVPVPIDLVYFSDYIAGMVPILRRYCMVRRQRELTVPEANVVARVLHEIDTFMYVKGIEQKKRQKRLRDYKIIEILIEMLQTPFAPCATSNTEESVKSLFNNVGSNPVNDFNDIVQYHHKNSFLVMNQVFNLLETYLTGNSRKNELYMARHIPFLWELFGTEMSVEPMFNEMLKDNIELIMGVGKAEIERVVNMLEHNKNDDFLEFLSVLCVCEGYPYRQHQTDIGLLLLDRKAGQKPPVYLTDVGPRDEQGRIDVMVTINARRTETLSDFSQSALDEDESTSSDEYMFLLRQLELFGNLCKGRHQGNINFVTKVHKYLTWDECFLCARSAWKDKRSPKIKVKLGNTAEVDSILPELPMTLRCIYVDLMVRLFIDVGDNRDILSEDELSFDWDTLTAKYFEDSSEDDTQALSGARFEQFPEVRDWVIKFLKETKGHMVHKHPQLGKPKNELITAVLSLLDTLINFGYYTDKDNIVDVMKPLESIMNGTNDYHELPSNGGRAVGFAAPRSPTISRPRDNSEDSKDTPVQLFSEEEVLMMWRKEGRYEVDDNGRTVVQAKLKALECVSGLYKVVFNVKLRTMLCDFKMFVTLDGNDRHAKVAQLHKSDHERWDSLQHFAPTITKILHHEKIVEKHAKDHKNFDKVRDDVRAYLANLSEHVNWITPGWSPGDKAGNWKKGADFSGKKKMTLVETLLDLAKYQDHRLLTKAMSLLEGIYSANELLVEMATRGVVVCTVPSKTLNEFLKHHVPQLAQLAGTVLSGDSIKTVDDVLTKCTAECFRKLPYIVEYEEFCNEPHHQINQQIIYNSGLLSVVLEIINVDHQPGVILASCFRLLRGLCRGFSVVQIELSLELDKILTTVGGSGDGVGEAWENTMARCVTEIFDGCKETCLRVTEEQVHQILSLLGEHKDSAPSFLNALEAIAKVEEWNLPLKRNQELITKQLWSARDQVVQIAFIDDGSDDIINEHRMTLLKGETCNLQLYHLYLVNLLAATCEGKNRQIEAMCRSIFTVQELIDTIADNDVPNNVKAPYVKFLLWVYLKTESTADEAGTSELNTNEELYAALMTVGTEEIASYFLPGFAASRVSTASAFTFDVFVPCIEQLVNRHFPNSIPGAVDDTSKSLQDMIIKICDVLVDMSFRICDSKCGVKMDKFRLFALTQLLTTFKARLQPLQYLGTEGGKRLLQALEKVSQKALKADIGVIEGDDEAFARMYKEETTRNKSFNQFVQELETAYRSSNTIEAQLGGHKPNHGKSVPVVDVTEEYCERPEEDEALPLGPEFQHLIKVFYHGSIGHGHFVRDHLNILVRLWDDTHTHEATYTAQERMDLHGVNVKFLQVVRGIIHNADKLEYPTSALQAEVANAGTILPTTRLLESHRHDVRRECLALIKIVLKDGLADAQHEFARHFLSTREETFFQDICRLISISKSSMVGMRELRQQKEESDRAGSKLRETMRTTIGQNVGDFLVPILKQGEEPPQESQEDIDAQMRTMTVNETFTVPMSRGLSPNIPAGHMEAPKQEEISAEQAAKDDDEAFFEQMKDVGNVTLVLSVLQGMCEGHNHVLQEYLRVQPDNITSTDLVSLCTDFLDYPKEDVNEYRELLVQLFNTLTEFAQGNVGNQRQIFNHGIADYINAITRCPIEQVFDGDEADEMEWAELHMGCANILLSLLEMNDSETSYMAIELDKILDISGILRIMRHYTDKTAWELSHADRGELDWDDVGFEPADVGFAYFNVIARLRDFTHRDYHIDKAYLVPDIKWREEKTHRYSGTFTESYKKMHSDTATIEILEQDEVQKIHFYVPREVKARLLGEWKDTLLIEVDRSSPTEKVRDFVERCRTIIADMKYIKTVMEFSSLTRALVMYSWVLDNIFLFITIILNLTMLFTWVAPDGNLGTGVGYLSELTTPIVENGGVPIIISLLGFLHLISAILIVLANYTQNPPENPLAPLIAFARKWLPFGKKVADEDEEDGDNNDELDTSDTVIGADAKGVVARLRDEQLIDRNTHRTRTSFFATSSIGHLFLLILSIMGIQFRGYTFAFCLLFVVKGNPNLENVIAALTRNGKSLLWVALLFIIVIYIYAVTAFGFFRRSFNNDDGAYCNTLLQCFGTAMRLGLMSGGGFGEALPFDPFAYDNVVPRFFFDVTYFLIVSIILMNVVFGIIVDTFSELREEKSQNDAAMKSECFICSCHASDFERFGNGFVTHTKHEHNMWDYLFFFYHLDQKESCEFTALEQTVAEKLLRNDYSFFPINRSLETKIDQDDGMGSKIDQIHSSLLARLERAEAREVKLLSEMSLLREARDNLVTRDNTNNNNRKIALSNSRSSVVEGFTDDVYEVPVKRAPKRSVREEDEYDDMEA